MKPTALEISTKLLTLPVPSAVQQQTKALMSGLFVSRASYHWHKVGCGASEIAVLVLNIIGTLLFCFGF